MKSLIVPIALIAVLITFFVLFVNKDFDRHDDVQTLQNETGTANEERSVSVPETQHMNDETPAVAANSVETKPVAETNPLAEMKPEEKVKPAETKPVARTTPEEKPIPVAIPVITPEEAIKRNKEARDLALAKKEKKEPFFTFYQDSKLESVCFQGTIRATSTIPDPETNDYDNCLYALFIEIDAVLSDVTADTEVASEAIVNVPIMKNKTILQDNKLYPGDKVLCTCSDFAAMPQSIQEIQISDDIQSYEHQQYFSIEIRKIESFQKEGNRNLAKRAITILPIQTLPRDEKAFALRRERIQNEIARVEEEIQKHGGSFEKWKEEYKPVADKYKKLVSEGYKGWINDSYFSAVGQETTYNTKAYIDWILPYKKYLQNNNIDLIVLRYPSRADFAARVLASDTFQENPAWVEHYYECLKNDIEIIDPMPEMWNKRYDYPLFYFYNSGKDHHPFEGELIVAAEKTAQVLGRYGCTADRSFELQKRSIKNNDLYQYPEGHSSFLSGAPVVFDGLSEKGEPIGCLQVNTGSPFLFLSNSFFGYRIMQEHGASVPHYASYFLQSMVDWKYQSAVRNAMIRNLINTPSALERRKAVIMIGNFETWTSGPAIPAYLFEKVDKIAFNCELNFLSANIVMDKMNPDIAVEDDGSLAILKGRLPFSFEINVPPVTDCDYKTCMMRINFGVIAQNIKISAHKKDVKIDEANQTLFSESYVDLFIPVSQLQDPITLTFSGGYQPYKIKNIEFWYY